MSRSPSNLRHLALAWIIPCAAAPLLAAPQDLRDFDAFIHHVRQEAASGDPLRIGDCFASHIDVGEDCGAVSTMELLGEDAQRFGWHALGRDIARFADGFVLIDTDGTMANLHARARGQQHLIEVLGDRVKFRRDPGASGAVIAMLDRGALPGRFDAARWAVMRDGTEWTPVIADIPGFGQVRGYIGSDYVREAQGQGDLNLTASYDGTRWALTGFGRERNELRMDCAHPTP